MTTDLQLAVAHLNAKRTTYDLLWRYYDGDHPLIYSTEKLKSIFKKIDARFTENWCAVVVDSVLDRMNLNKPSVINNKDATKTLEALWASTGMADDVYSVHEDVAVTGEGFVIAWLDDAGKVQTYQNDARLCHAQYDEENPRQLRFAAKWWSTPEKRVRLNLYYEDRIEYYVTAKELAESEQATAKSFEPMENSPAANPFDRIPVFHFRSNKRGAKSQLDSVVQPQDAVNKLLADMMIAAEFGAYPQRFVISAQGIEGANLRNNPNEIWDLVGGVQGDQATVAGQFDPTDLKPYLDALNNFCTHIGIISRTPRHYFYMQGGDPSGEALIAMEAPLVKKCERLQAMLAPAWQALSAFVLELAGLVVTPTDVWAGYEEPATMQPKTQAEIRKTSVEAGMPLRTVLKTYEGWTNEDIEEMDDDAEAEQVAMGSYADAVLNSVQKSFDQGVVK